jgi:hypothetical protein
LRMQHPLRAEPPRMRRASWMTTSSSKYEGQSWLPAHHCPRSWRRGSNADGKNRQPKCGFESRGTGSMSKAKR